MHLEGLLLQQWWQHGLLLSSFPALYSPSGLFLSCFDTGDQMSIIFPTKADVGDKFHMKATVKEHSEYQGQAQTVVQRITILE